MTTLSDALRRHGAEILADWQRELTSGARRDDRIKTGELEQQTGELLRLIAAAVSQDGASPSVDGASFEPVRDLLSQLSSSRARQGFSPREVAGFVLSLKRPIFARLRLEVSDPAALAQEMWRATELIDALGVFTTEVYQRSREEVIARQQQELLELSTPVVKLWEGILALPLIGTLDSARTQVVMESLLQTIATTSSRIAIIDITGVPAVDTLVAQHLLKTVAAARLMGAECFISGIRPQIAQTIVHLGVNLGDVVTKSSLADAFVIALQRMGHSISRAAVKGPGGA
jgi:rsbT co-antagonist protein RsbR